MHEHAPSSLTEEISLEEEKGVRLYILEELKRIIKTYTFDKEEQTPHKFLSWIKILTEGGTVPLDEYFNEQDLARDVRRFERLYQELANIALKKTIGKEVREELRASPMTLERAIEALGRENVHGPEDVELLLGFKPSNIPPIPYTTAYFEKSKEIKEKTGVEEMLVLFVHDEKGKPLTGEKLNKLIQKKYDELGLGKFLSSLSWYENAKFYTELSLSLEWKLVTKTCLPDSYLKHHHYEAGDNYAHEDTQEYVIEQFATKFGIPRTKLERPEPFAMAYAIALHLVATKKLRGEGERLLEKKDHWSDVQTWDADFVRVGYADREGAFVGGDSRTYYGDGSLGVCLSR